MRSVAFYLIADILTVSGFIYSLKWIIHSKPGKDRSNAVFSLISMLFLSLMFSHGVINCLAKSEAVAEFVSKAEDICDKAKNYVINTVNKIISEFR